MSVECFFDTNVLVYAVSAAAEDRAKQERALDLLETADFALSTQVLQELYVTLTRKIRRPLAVEQVLALLEEYRVFPIVITDYALILSAIEHSRRYRISYWDGAIVAAAEAIAAPILYTEDLQSGQTYGAVVAVNPFV